MSCKSKLINPSFNSFEKFCKGRQIEWQFFTDCFEQLAYGADRSLILRRSHVDASFVDVSITVQFSISSTVIVFEWIPSNWFFEKKGTVEEFWILAGTVEQSNSKASDVLRSCSTLNESPCFSMAPAVFGALFSLGAIGVAYADSDEVL